MDELAGLSEQARKLAMERLRQLQPHLENNEPLASVAQAAGIPYRTAPPPGVCVPPVRLGRSGPQEARGSRRTTCRLHL